MAANLDFSARQGTAFRRTFEYTAGSVAVDMTGWDIKMHVRKSANSEDILLELNLGDEFSWTVGGASAGSWKLEIPADIMAEVPPSPPEGWDYDLKLIPTLETAFALLEGKFIVKPETTKT